MGLLAKPALRMQYSWQHSLFRNSPDKSSARNQLVQNGTVARIDVYVNSSDYKTNSTTRRTI